MSQAWCNSCGRLTKQDIIAIDTEKYDDVVGDRTIACYDRSEMLKCRGCGAVSMRLIAKHVEDPEARIIYYPPFTARHTPSWVAGSFESLAVPMSVFRLMNEVYIAVQNDLRRLAAMGIRATLEHVMRDKVGDHRTFKTLVDEFRNAGYLSTRQAGSLDTILEAGHAAVHRGWEPTKNDIATLLDITEAVIETAYLHEARAQALNERVPKREKPV